MEENNNFTTGLANDAGDIKNDTLLSIEDEKPSSILDEEKKFCVKCGAEIANDQVFCPKCGHKVGDKVKSKGTGGAKKFIILAICLVVLIAGGIVLFLILMGTQAKEITLNKDTLSIKAGDTATLTFVISPEDTKDKTVVWKSSNESIATVSGGTITAINEGSCTISISTNNGKTDSCEITVTPSGPDFNALYNEFCSSKYAKVATDGSYLSIDTNPYDIDDSFDYDAYTAITKINEAVELPESVLNKMEQTRSLDGMQTYTGKEVEVSWSYHPNNGLEVIYSLID